MFLSNSSVWRLCFVRAKISAEARIHESKKDKTNIAYHHQKKKRAVTCNEPETLHERLGFNDLSGKLYESRD